ncbi:hypothetical protein KYC_25733 [Achromobacter arsenitoxydans SY8]|uniref:Uncharacterized protein n=1 Tax=Achromobacter arsenitoxydans SY8 TaxID=477184 RepID=H0FED5_9BURK|nr:hypothetical protein KYC_25733 [Achromobacter arsenitoxydans SY8]
MQQLHQLVLPLFQQRLWSKHQDRTTIRLIQRHQHGRHGELHRLAEANLVSQYQTGTSEAMTL